MYLSKLSNVFVRVWKKLKPSDIFHGDLSDSLPPLLFSYKATLGPNSTQTWSYLTFQSSQYYNLFCQSESRSEYLRNNKEQCSRGSGTTIKREANTWPSNHVVSQQLNTTCIPMGTASQKTQSNNSELWMSSFHQMQCNKFYKETLY